MSDVLQVHVETNDWGEAPSVDIELLLTNAASHLNRELWNPVAGTINVRRAPLTDHSPRTLIGESRPGSYVVQLTAKDRLWSQYAFQFVHEFCHVLIDPFSWHPGPNSWFEESVCELASVFVLRRMSEQWTTDPPYRNWSSYSSSLVDYANQRLSAPQRTLPDSICLSEWLSANEGDLRQGPELAAAEQWATERRDKMAVIAYALLPLFEKQPEAWNAVQRLPRGQHPARDNPTRDYLRSWRSAVAPRDEHVVDQVGQLLGIL